MKTQTGSDAVLQRPCYISFAKQVWELIPWLFNSSLAESFGKGQETSHLRINLQGFRQGPISSQGLLVLSGTPELTPLREHDQSLLRHGKRSRRGTESIGSSLIGG